MATPAWLPTLVLGLAVVGCDPKPDDSGKKKAEPTKAEPAKPDADTAASGADAGATAEPTVEDPRPAEKYGAPPLPDDKLEAIEPAPDPSPDPVAEDPRPAKKYGAPPPVDPRPAPKYGGPPKPPTPTP